MIGVAQEYECDKSKGNYFKVSAESGLNIRKEPNSKSEKIYTIPFESIVFACKECNACKTEIIEGKRAKWKQIFFEDYEGFVFGGFLEPQIEIMCPLDWIIEFGIPSFRKDIDYFGIYEKDTFRNQFRANKFEEIDSITYDPIKGELNIGKLKNKPNFIISGIDLTDDQTINGKNYNSKMLFVGEAIYFQSSYLYVTGNPEISDNNIFPFTTIRDYKLILRQPTENEEFKEQVVFTNDFLAWIGGGGYEGGILIRWIGDIDGDNKIDILLSHATHYACWNVILFLSTKANENELVGQAANYEVCGC